MIKDLFKTLHSSEQETGTSEITREETTYMMFLDLIYECEGNTVQITM